jgi:uncharacterized protein (TIGR02145 family)
MVAIVGILIVFASSCKEEEAPQQGEYIKGNGEVLDIDGNVYQTVIIGHFLFENLGTQEWMTENLRTTRYSNGDLIINATEVLEWLELSSGAWSWPNNDSENNQSYGKLYNWYAAADSRNICPTGWRVPSDADWTSLISILDVNLNPEGTLDQSLTAGGLMKEQGTDHWNSPNVDASNKSGFTARGAGARGGDYHWFGEAAYWWSQTEFDEEYAWYRFVQNSNAGFHRWYIPCFKQFGFSIRCVKNADDYVGLPTIATSEVTNITTTTASSGGNINDDGGAEVTARGVVWSTSPNATLTSNDGFTTDGSGVGVFTSNLTNLSAQTTYFVRAYATNSQGTAYGSNVSFSTALFEYGEDIVDIDENVYKTVIIGAQTWLAKNLTTTTYNDGSIIVYGNENSLWEGTNGVYTWYNNDIANAEIYGALYNWHAVNTGKLCPTGWHVPSQSDWNTLFQYVGGNVATKLRATSGWDNDGNGTNEYGFNGLPGGYRNIYYHSFYNAGTYGYWWSSTQHSVSEAELWFMSSGSGSITQNYSIFNAGYSVRCLKD